MTHRQGFMIKDKAFWESWERQTQIGQPPDFEQNLQLFEALYEHARSLGVWAPADPLEGLEFKIQWVSALNAPTLSRANRPRS